MRNTKLVGVSILMVTGMVQGARAGGSKPAWCTDSFLGGDESGLKDTDVTRQLETVVNLKCNPDQVKTPAALDATAKQLEARFGMTAGDWADVAEWLGHPAEQEDLKPRNNKKAWSQLDPIEQFAMIKYPRVMAGWNGLIDPTYATDALGGRISETGRLAFVRYCLNKTDDNPVQMAMCQPDIDALDGKKLAAELRTPGHTGFERMVIRWVYDETKPQIAARREQVKKLIASDAGYKQMFEIAKQQRAEWDARWKANGEPLALATAMDDAAVTDSRKASTGCQEKAWHALAGTISTVPAKAFTKPRQADDVDTTYAHTLRYAVMNALLSEPEAYLASAALATCYKLETPKDTETASNIDVPDGLLSELRYWIGMRGPRTATAARILQAGIQFDDRGAKIELPQFRYYWQEASWSSHGGALGTVTAVKPKGDLVNLVFKTKDVKVYTSTGCHPTGQIRGIMSNGEFDYVNVCTGARESIEHKGPIPHDVTKNFAGVVKPGNLVLVIGDTVLLVWKDPKAPAPSYALGQPVK